MRSKIFHIEPQIWLSKALQFANRHNNFCYLNPNNYENGFDHVLAIKAKRQLESNDLNIFESLKNFQKNSTCPIFGYFSYDLKNQVEQLSSENTNHTAFPAISFFEPEVVIRIVTSNEVIIEAQDPDLIFNNIEQTSIEKNKDLPQLNFRARTDKKNYYSNFESIREHIINGDIYELNYCIEFYNKNADIDVLETYLTLKTISPSPFSSIYKSGSYAVMSSSPERFMKKEGHRVISQPMKGTAKRSQDPVEDIRLKNNLLNSEKERSENLMIVDLVRHDLSHLAVKGSVNVEELFGLYSFPKVHQMISTISMNVDETVSAIDIIRHAFPMGSMTGAPKIMAMKLIDHYENYQRNIFSGALGYITPHGDFDFNVLIRSLFYNTSTNYLSFSAGSAITYDANAEDEYNECLLKANSISQCFKK